MPGKISLSDVLGAPISKEAALQQILSMPDSRQQYHEFPEKMKEEILSFLCGQKGLEILYDRFFKFVFDYETHPKRIEKLISALLGEPVMIREFLPPEGSLLVDKGSFVIMDIIAELSDGSLVDVEMQKLGYRFPVQRSACYVSDMIMRQYNRVKNERKNVFDYRDIKDVYLFIIMDESSEVFRRNKTASYIHHKCTFYDSGIDLPEIEHITYNSLDIFRDTVQNIDTQRDAWMTFLSRNDPESIVKLVGRYPEFLSYYHDIAEFRKDPREVLHMFSEALYILDRNTERLMVDDLREERDTAVANLEAAKKERDAAFEFMRKHGYDPEEVLQVDSKRSQLT